MAKQNIPAWRVRLTNDHDSDRGPGFFRDRFFGLCQTDFNLLVNWIDPLWQLA